MENYGKKRKRCVSLYRKEEIGGEKGMVGWSSLVSNDLIRYAGFF